MATYSSLKSLYKKNKVDVSPKSYADLKKERQDRSYYSIDDNYINDFLNSSQNYFSSVKNDFDTMGYNNAQSIYDLNKSKLSRMADTSSAIRSYYNFNRNNIGEDNYNSMISYLDEFKRNSDSVLSGMRNNINYYSQWASEAEYNKALEESQKREKLQNTDINSLGREIVDIENHIKTLKNDFKTYEDNYAANGGYLPYKQYKAASPEQLEGYKKYSALYTDYQNKLEQLQAEHDEKQSYFAEAKTLQDEMKLAAAPKNADFEEYAKKGAEMQAGDGFTPRISFDWSQTQRENEMTAEEQKIYNYYIGKGDKVNAERYMKSIENQLSQRAIQTTYDKLGLENSKLYEMAFGIAAGVDQFSSGVEGLADMLLGTDKSKPQRIIQGVNALAKEDLANVGPKILGSSLGQITNDILSTTTNMAPAILVSSLTGMPLLGDAIIGGTATGTAYSEALREGYTKDQASIYSTIVGTAEATLQYLLGGIGSLGRGGDGLFGGLTEKALYGIDKMSYKFLSNKTSSALMHTFLSNATKLAGNMASEGAEEYLQDLMEPILKNFLFNEHNDIDPLADEKLYSGLLGALSAGLLEGGSTIKSGVDTYKAGKTIAGNTEAIERLNKVGSTFSADTVAYKLAGKVNENTDAYTLGRMLNEVDATLTEQNKGDIKRELINRGIDENNADTIADWLAAAVEGEYFSDSQISALENNDIISDVFRDVIVNQNSTVNQRMYAYATDIAEGNADARTEAETVVNSVEPTVEAPEVQKPVEMAQSEPEQTIDEALASVTNKRLDQASIDQIKNEYDGSIPAADFVEGMLNGFDYGYTYGKYNTSYDSFTNESWNKLSDTQKDHAYRLGVAKANADVTARNKQIESGANGKTGYRRGNVKAINTNMRELKSAFNDQQNRAYKVLDEVAKVTGFDIALYKSNTNAKGEFEGAQGKFRRSDNTIYIDINAGLKNKMDVNDLGKYAMLRTLTHEMTHTGEYWAPTEYDTLKTLVFDTMKSNGENVNDLIETKMAETGLDYVKASREVVAEAMTDILPQAKFAERMANENPGLFKKFLAHLKKFLNNIKEYFKSVGHNTAQEPKSLKEERDGQLQYIQSIVDAYDNMIIKASQNYQLNFAVNEKVAKEKTVSENVSTETASEAVAEDTKPEIVETPVVEEAEEVKTEYNPTDAEKAAISEAMNEPPKSAFPTQIEEAPTISKTEPVENTLPVSKTAVIANKIIKGTTKKSGQTTLGIESSGKYLLGNGAVLAVVDKATYDSVDVAKKAAFHNVYSDVNALNTKITTPAYKSAEGIVTFNTPGNRVSLTQKYAKYFDGYDFYYNPKNKKSPLAIKDGDTLVGVILPVNTTEEFDFTNAELVHFKSFDKYLNKEDVANGEQVRKINEGTVSQSDTDRSGDTRLLDEVQEADVRGDVSEGESVQPVEAGVGETGRDDNRADAERNGSGRSDGSSEVGDLRRDGELLSPEEKAARDYATEKGYTLEINELAKNKHMIQVDIHSKDGHYIGIDPVIIATDDSVVDNSKWNKVKEAIDSYEKYQEEKAKKLEEVVEQQVEEKSTETPKGSNFVISDSLNLPEGEKSRFRANVDAIKLVKQLEAEGRYATAAEQEVLSKYVGWGGLSNAFGELIFNRETRKSEMTAKKGWENEFAELKQLVDDGIITEQEYKDASASTKNAHYTSVEVIKAMYKGLEQLGFNGGRMLEPSSGVGNFVGAMPVEMSSKVNSWTMVELDSITGNIAKYLYPNADVRVQGFEKANIPNNYMDVAIGNVPFGNYGIVDKAYPNRVKKAIHNYFFAKSLDKVRPGGIVMFITSSFTMNGQDAAIRQYIMERADLLGAIRLPNTAFKGNAGTEVVTDILVLKKRKPGTEYAGEAFLESPRVRPSESSYNYANVNEYFNNHPEMVLGTPEFARGMYGSDSLTYKPFENKGSIDSQIVDAFRNIKGKMDYETKVTPEKSNFNAQRADRKTKNNGLVSKDGKIYKNDNGTLVEQSLNENDAKKVADVLSIRDSYKQLINYIQQGQAENLIKSARKQLNDQYDAFVKKNGFLNEAKNKKLFEADPDHYSILSLENYDSKAKKATKADIFTKDTIKPNRTVNSVDSISDGVIVSLNTLGRVDAEHIAKLTGRTAEDVTRELIDTKAAFKTPNGTLEAPETYLSGNVRAKLREAEALAPLDKDFKNNVEELKKVIPKDIPYNDIYVTPGTPWIPVEVYADFIAEMLGGRNNINSYSDPDVVVGRSATTGDYTIQLNNPRLKTRFNNTQQWGTNRRTFLNIIQAMMSNSSLTVNDTIENAEGKKVSVLNKVETEAVQQKAKEITAEFQRWLWDNENRRTELASLYNETFNALVNPKYSGKNLTVNGLNAAFDLREHQANAVQRVISSGGNTLLAHRVGAGKTLEMASAAMKLRELGIVKKPMFAVPKSLVAQWGVEFKSYFPAAKLLVADEKSFTKANRKLFTNQIANGDYDAIIVSYEQFEKVPMSAQYQAEFYQKQIDEIIAAVAEEKAESRDGKGLTVKEMEKKRAQLEKKIQELTTKEKDEDNIDFEQLGIDSLFVDEAHNFKNLQYVTRMNNVAGLGNTNGSQRAFDLYTKIRYLQGLNGGRGIVFATATPVMNSMAEMYIMQKYLQSDMLNQLGLNTFDAWAKQFGEVTSSLEVKPSGQGYRKKETFSNFKNLNELQLLFRSFSDVLTDVPGLKIPKMKGGQVQIVECEPGEFQKNYMKDLEKRAQNVKNVDASVDNMLKITSDGRKVSYTQRMIDPTLPYETGSKIFRCCDNVISEYKASKKIKGTQIVFCDMATPKGKAKTDTNTDVDDTELDTDSARLYDDMKSYLIKKGIPANEIAFIHDAVTDQQRKQLFADVNDGKVRVLIGSTGKMGVGMNAQQRIVAIHHLDAPWRPGDVEQRDGRAFRQKNMNEEVSKYVYVTKGSFDARLWDILNRKQNFINQIMNGNDVGRSAEDTGDVTLSAAEVMAVASGNPLIKESVELTSEIQTLEDLQKAHSSAILTARTKMQRDTQAIATYTKQIENANKDIKTRTNTYSDETFAINVDGKKFTDKKEAGVALANAVETKTVRGDFVTLGNFAGFDLQVMNTGAELVGQYVGAQTYKFGVYPNNTTYMINQLCSNVASLEDKVKAWKSALDEAKSDLAAQEKAVNEPFAKQAELDAKRARYNEVMAILNPAEEQQAVGDDDVQEQRRSFDEYTKQKLEKQIDNWDGKTVGFSFNYGFVSDALIEAGLPYKQIRLDATKASKILGKHNGMSRDTIKGIYDLLQSPTLVIDSKSNPDSRIVMGDLYDDNGKIVTVVLLLTPTTRNETSLDIIKISSAEGRSHIESLFQKADGTPVEVRYTDKNRIQSWLNVNRLQLPLRSTRLDSEDIINPYNAESQEQNQERTSPLTNRELLTMARDIIPTSDFTEGEKTAFDVFNKRLDRLNDLQNQRQELGSLYKEQQFGSNVDRKAAAETLNRMHTLDDMIKKASNDVLDVEEKEVLKRVLTKARNIAEKQERERGRQVLENWRNRRKELDQAKKYKEKIKTDVNDLSTWLLKPDNKVVTKHIPDVLKNTVVDFLGTIDLSSDRKLRGGEATKADIKFVERLKKLQEAIKNNASVTGLYSGYNDLPEGFMDELQSFIDMTNGYINNHTGEFIINRMSAAELKDLSHIIKTVKRFIKQMNEFHENAIYKHVYEAGDNSYNTLRGMKNASTHTGGVSNFLLWENMRPAYAFERFGEGGKAIYDEFRRAQSKLAYNAKQIIDFSNETYTSEEVNAWEKEEKEFVLGGDKVKIPVSYIMGFYELSKQPDSLRHILGEGLRVATYKMNGKTKVSDVGHELSQQDVMTIVDSLTDRQKEVADKLQKYMATVGADWGNYVSVKRFGEQKFTNPVYYPINSDGRHIDNNMEEAPSNASLYALLNMSFTKARNEEANNRIILYSIFDVFANHMASMAQYNAFALPVLDALKWFNYKSTIEGENGRRQVVGSLREELSRVYGVPEENRPGSGRTGYAESFITNIIKAYNGTETHETPSEGLILGLTRKYNMAQVAYNFRVVVQQPMAITRAGMLISYNSIRKALSVKPSTVSSSIEEMNAHSGIAQWKSLGFYDTNISRGLTDTIKHKQGVMETINEVGMSLAEKADQYTWATMWRACKEEVSAKSELTPGSDEYFEEVTKLFEDIVYKTQVVDSVLTKTEFMRRKDAVSRILSAFMSEPSTTASMVLSAYDKFATDMNNGLSRSEAWRKNKNLIGRTTAVYAISAITLAAVQAVIDGMRDDDDEDYLTKYLSAFGGNVIDELTPFNKLPFISDIYEAAKNFISAWGVDTYGNPPKTLFTQWLDALIKGSEILNKKINGVNTGYTWYAGVAKMLQALSGTGLPISTITREVVTAWNNTVGAINSDLKILKYKSSK